MQELIAKHKTDIPILLESHCTTQAPTILNYKTIAHKKCNANSQFPIGGIIIYIKSYLTNIHHLQTSNNHDIIWLQIKHNDNTLTHIAACYTRTAIKNYQQINSEFFTELHSQIIKFKKLGEVIILGDLNTRLGNIIQDLTNLSPCTNNNAPLLNNIINSENLTILNTKHQLGIKTYHKKSYTSNKIASSIIDYCLITPNTAYNYFQIHTNPWYNDHRPLILSIPLIHKTNPTKQKIYKLKYIKETFESEEYENAITEDTETLKLITKYLNHKNLINSQSLHCANFITISTYYLLRNLSIKFFGLHKVSSCKNWATYNPILHQLYLQKHIILLSSKNTNLDNTRIKEINNKIKRELLNEQLRNIHNHRRYEQITITKKTQNFLKTAEKTISNCTHTNEIQQRLDILSSSLSNFFSDLLNGKKITNAN